MKNLFISWRISTFKETEDPSYKLKQLDQAMDWLIGWLLVCKGTRFGCNSE
jgi:hypothetical protein